MIRVIRSLENPDLIKAFGYVEEKGLGEYNKKKWEEVELEALPVDIVMFKDKEPAMGLDLLKYLSQSTLKGMEDSEAFEMVETLSAFFIMLQQGRCNPMSKDTRKNLLDILKAKLEGKRRKQILALIDEWLENKRYADDED